MTTGSLERLCFGEIMQAHRSLALASLIFATILASGCTRRVLSHPVTADVYMKASDGEFVWMGATPYTDKNIVWGKSCWRVEAPGYQQSEEICVPGGPDTITVLYYLKEADIHATSEETSLDIGAALRDAQNRFQAGDLSARQYRRLKTELIWSYISG